MQEMTKVDYVVEKNGMYWTMDVNGRVFFSVTLFPESYFNNKTYAEEIAKKYNANVGKCTTKIKLEKYTDEQIKTLERKAQAFDAIVDIEDDFVKYHGFSPCVEEYAEEVEEVISEYMVEKNMSDYMEDE